MKILFKKNHKVTSSTIEYSISTSENNFNVNKFFFNITGSREYGAIIIKLIKLVEEK